jgi:hypothetical protein
MEVIAQVKSEPQAGIIVTSSDSGLGASFVHHHHHQQNNNHNKIILKNNTGNSNSGGGGGGTGGANNNKGGSSNIIKNSLASSHHHHKISTIQQNSNIITSTPHLIANSTPVRIATLSGQQLQTMAKSSGLSVVHVTVPQVDIFVKEQKLQTLSLLLQ